MWFVDGNFVKRGSLHSTFPSWATAEKTNCNCISLRWCSLANTLLTSLPQSTPRLANGSIVLLWLQPNCNLGWIALNKNRPQVLVKSLVCIFCFLIAVSSILIPVDWYHMRYRYCTMYYNLVKRSPLKLILHPKCTVIIAYRICI